MINLKKISETLRGSFGKYAIPLSQVREMALTDAIYFMGNQWMLLGKSDKALEFYNMASDRGHAEALCDLALIDGVKLEADDDPGPVLERLKKSAALGSSRAAFNAGIVLYSGFGKSSVSQEERAEEGLKYLRQSAEAGFTRAQLMLAAIYLAGGKTPVDYKEAAKWLKKAQGFF